MQAGSKRPRSEGAPEDPREGLVPPDIIWHWEDDAFGTWNRPARDARFCEVVLPAAFPSELEGELGRSIAAFRSSQNERDGHGTTRAEAHRASPDGPLLVSHTVWLPSLLRPEAETLRPGFASVGFGNKLNIYVAARLAAALLGLRLSVAPMPFTLSPLHADVDYRHPAAAAGALPPSSLPDATLALMNGDVLMTPAVGSPADAAFLPPAPLIEWLRAQQRVGAAYVLTRPSFFTLCPLLQSQGCVGMVGAWLAPLARRMVAASIAAERAAAASASAPPASGAPPAAPQQLLRLSEPGTWVVHLRTGDVWVERGAGGARGRGGSSGVNSSYAPPPVWWYGWLARRYRPTTVLIVSSHSGSTLVDAVDAVLRSAGVPDVRRVSQTPEADFGVLVRAHTVVASVSTFAWWAAFVAAFMHSEPLAGAGAGPPRVVRVFWPQTGMAHPRSIHHCHAWLRLASQPPLDWVDPARVEAVTKAAKAPGVGVPAASGGTSVADEASPRPLPLGLGPYVRRSAELRVQAFDLGVLDGWSSSEAQQASILAADPPEWFLRVYGAAAEGDG